MHVPECRSRPRKFCQCSRCSLRVSSTPVSDNTPGQYVSYSTYNLHRRHDLRLRHVALGNLRGGPEADGEPIGSHNDLTAELSDSLACNSMAKRSLADAEIEDAPISKKRRKTTGLCPSRAHMRLEEIRQDVRRHILSFQIPNHLVFAEQPSATSSREKVPDVMYTTIPSTSPTNKFIQYRDYLTRQLNLSQSISISGDSKDLDANAQKSLEALITERLQSLERIKLFHWQKQVDLRSWHVQEPASTDGSGPVPFKVYDTGHYHENKGLSLPLLTQLCFVIVVTLNLIAGAPIRTCNFVLESIRLILGFALMFDGLGQGRHHTAYEELLLKNMPINLSTALEKLALDPEVQYFACCPACFAIYPPTLDAHGNSKYPSTCSHRETPGSPPCNQPLLKAQKRLSRRKIRRRLKYHNLPPREEIQQPRKCFAYQPMESWLGRLLSRAGVEDLLEKCWVQAENSGGRWYDIWDAPLLKQFLGWDGRPFSCGQNTELRLVFSLFVDWFNPYTNKSGGKHASVGGIYMACLNLPKSIRFRPENIYLVGIIPGPKEPVLSQINHVLRPVVDSLLSLWHPGVFFTQTAKFSAGRLVRCALIPLICDLPALRKAAGFSSPKGKWFCSFCRLQLMNICNFSPKTWPSCSAETHRMHAKRWKEAPTEKERQDIFGECGFRWSELLRLPYWQPSLFSVLDSMHNLFLGIIQHHCREIWGMDVTSGEKARLRSHSREEQVQNVNAVVEELKESPFRTSVLDSFRKNYLIAVAYSNGIAIPSGSTKEDIIARLISWREEYHDYGLFVPDVPPDGDNWLDGTDKLAPLSILGYHELQRIHHDIARTSLPHWIEPPPKNLGSKGHGKLKADQWRTVATVSLVISLVTMWGGRDATELQREQLRNFIDLVIAVRHATFRSTCSDFIQVYENHMKRYLETMVRLYGEGFVMPNHHFALHLPMCLRCFGPVHSWWSYPFEQLNGILQRMNTNKQLGKLEITLLQTFCRAANLRNFINQANISGPWSKLSPIINKYFGLGSRGTVLNDMLSLDDSPDLNETLAIDYARATELAETAHVELVQLLQSSDERIQNYANDSDSVPRMVEYRKKYTSKGVDYCLYESNANNSYVQFQVGQSILTGRIRSIFLHERADKAKDGSITEAFFEIDSFAELSSSDALLDPFRQFQGLGAKLCYERISDRHLVRSRDVISHVAICPYENTDEGVQNPCFIVVSLDRDGPLNLA